MRRLALIGFGLTAAVGCDWSAETLDYQSTLTQQTNGVALRGTDEWGDNVAQVGMSGTTCEVETRWASLGSDYDYPGQDEAVLDADEEVVVIASEDKLHIQRGDGFLTAASDDYDVSGVSQASIAGDTVVALAEDGGECTLNWVGAQTATVRLDSGSCDETYDITADPITGGVFVGSDHGVTYETPSTTQVVTEDPSQMVAWDRYAEVLYAAEVGSTVLRGVEADGALRWSTDVGGTIISLDDMGTRASAAVSIQTVTGTGGIVVVDGWSGAITQGVDTPTAASEIKGSPDGRAIALVERDQVHFYRFGTVADQWSGFETDFGDWDIDW